MRWLALVAVACGGRSDRAPEPPPAPVVARDAAPIAPDATTADYLDTAPVALLAAIPADTPFLFATLDPIDRGVWASWLAGVHPTDGGAPLDIALNAVVRGQAGIAPSPRVAVYADGAALIVRVDLAKPDLTRALIATLPKQIDTLHVTVVGSHLAIAIGAPDAVSRAAPHLARSPSHPLDVPALRDAAKAAGFSPLGAGWVDLARLATPDCIARPPRIDIGLTEATAHRLTLAARMPAPNAITKDWARIPAGKPWLAIAVAPGTQIATCMPAPWSAAAAGTFALYSARFEDGSLRAVDAYARIATADPATLASGLAKLMPDIKLEITGNTLAFGSRETTESPGVLVSARIDIDALATHLVPPPAIPDDAFFTAEDVDDSLAPGLERVLAAATLEISRRGGTLLGSLSLDIAAPRAPAPDPRDGVRADCRTLVRHAFTAIEPAIVKLGLSADALAPSYVTSAAAGRAVHECAVLTAAERACLLAAKDPITAACGVDIDRLAFPIVSLLTPDPLDARLHPPIDGAAALTQLAGTWRGDSTTLALAPSGQLTTTGSRGSETSEVVIPRAGLIETVKPDNVMPTGYWTDGKRLVLTNSVAQVAAPDRWVVPSDNGYIIREPSGCWVVTPYGELEAATCSEADHLVDVGKHGKFRVVSGWVIDDDAYQTAHIRQ